MDKIKVDRLTHDFGLGRLVFAKKDLPL